MTTEDPRVRLPAAESRCRPSGDCGMASHCARRLAPVANGSPVADHHAMNVMVFGCLEYLKASDYTGKKEEPRPVKKHWSEPA